MTDASGSSGRHAVVTQGDIAQLLGISQKTVSQALSGGGSVGEELRARITSTAHRLGYQVRPSGRLAAARARSRRLVLAMASESDTGRCPDPLLRALTEVAADQRLELVVATFSGDSAGSGQPTILQTADADGLLVCFNIGVPPQLPEQLARGRLPALWLNLDLATDAIRPDDAGAAAQAVRRCLQLGHRRIAWMDRHYGRLARPHYSRQARRDGYLLAMREAGLPTLEIPSEVQALPWIGQLLRDPGRRPSVALCYGSQEVECLVGCLQTLGLRMPEDLSLVYFADQPRAMVRDITGPIIHYRRMAEVAVGRLATRIAGGGDDRSSAVIPCLWHAGDSLAPAPGA